MKEIVLKKEPTRKEDGSSFLVSENSRMFREFQRALALHRKKN